MVDGQLDIDCFRQFPSCDSPPQHLPEDCASRTDHALSIEPTKGCAPRHFCRHPREHVPRWAGGHQGVKIPRALDQVVSNIPHVRFRRFCKDLDHGIDEEFLLGPPPAINRSFTDARFRSDGVDAHALNAPRNE